MRPYLGNGQTVLMHLVLYCVSLSVPFISKGVILLMHIIDKNA